MSRLRYLTGPAGRRVSLALAVAAAWLAWLTLPPRPLREWATKSLEPVDWLLTADRTQLACVTMRERLVFHDRDAHLGDEYGPVRLWDLATGRERLTARPNQPVDDRIIMRIAPDGSWLFTVPNLCADGSAMQFWDTATGQELWSTPNLCPPGIELFINLVVSPDGRFVACRRSADTADVLLTATGHVHRALGNAWPLAFGPDNRTLVTAKYDAYRIRPTTITVWDIADGRQRGPFALKPGVTVAAAISPDGHWLAVGQLTKNVDPYALAEIELWDLRVGERITTITFRTPMNFIFQGLKFSPDGSLLIAPADDGSQRLWDMTRSPPRAIDTQGEKHFTFGQTYPIFSPDGSRFVVPGPMPYRLALRETAAPDRTVFGRSDLQIADQPAFSPDGRMLAVLHMLPSLATFQQTANRLFQALGRRPFFATERHELAFFDTTTGAAAGRINGLEVRTHLIGFGPDGRGVWTMTYGPDANGDGTLRVQEWAVPTGWPPPWLLAVTALGVLLAVADWRRNRQRRAGLIDAVRAASVGGPVG